MLFSYPTTKNRLGNTNLWLSPTKSLTKNMVDTLLFKRVSLLIRQAKRKDRKKKTESKHISLPF